MNTRHRYFTADVRLQELELEVVSDEEYTVSSRPSLATAAIFIVTSPATNATHLAERLIVICFHY
jgi:hypothetical protein